METYTILGLSTEFTRPLISKSFEGSVAYGTARLNKLIADGKPLLLELTDGSLALIQQELYKTMLFRVIPDEN